MRQEKQKALSVIVASKSGIGKRHWRFAWDGWIAQFIFMGFPLICASIWARGIIEILLEVMGSAWWLAILIGIAIPVVSLARFMGGKPDPMDCIVMSIILLIFFYILFPVFRQARDRVILREQLPLQPQISPASSSMSSPPLQSNEKQPVVGH